jgi:mevalonate kinase
MPAISSRAPGKAILFGEHAVVYGQPAIAVPIFQYKASTYITANPKGDPGEVFIDAPDVNLTASLTQLDANHPFETAITETLKSLRIDHLPACQIRIVSTIPIASGLGSGAAIAVSLVRAVSTFLGHPLPNAEISRIAFEVDRFYHGNPSGIDNTVIAFEKPVFFIKNKTIEFIPVPRAFDLIVADSGVKSSTREMVAGMAARRGANPEKYDDLFSKIGSLSIEARQKIESGDMIGLGKLINQNQSYLREADISNPALEKLIEAAMYSGALGAKLSGAGGGGNIIALTDPDNADQVANGLTRAGALNVIHTIVKQGEG